ncbi:unnamed protein product [Ectocarpus sp. CCAP 1310/34]|nr:unnamed protein product [Ectocarpus sp. CCAP 1310/34]
MIQRNKQQATQQQQEHTNSQ